MRIWWKFTWRTLVGAIFFGIGVALTVMLVWRSSLTQPPSASETVAYVVLAGLFQYASVYTFNRNGKPDANHSAAAVRRLVRLAERAGELRRDANNAFAGDPPAEAKRKLGVIGAQLEYLAIDALDSVEDWTSFNADARAKLAEIGREQDESEH